MKKLRNFSTFITTAALFCSMQSSAQMPGYKTGLGLRGGNESGLTVKHFLQDDRAIEGILSRSWGHGGFRITGLYEVHRAFPGVKNLDWFFGAGAHVGSYKAGYYGFKSFNGGYYDKDGNWYASGYKENYTAVGVDGIIGLEYQFSEYPFSMALDVKPFFDFVGGSSHYADAAFSLRYTLK